MTTHIEGLEIDWIGGNCPVQAEGRIDGKPFYFRARGQRWTIGIGGKVVSSPDWGYGEYYGEGPFEAGWMDEDTAMGFIVQAMTLFREGAESRCDLPPNPPADYRPEPRK